LTQFNGALNKGIRRPLKCWCLVSDGCNRSNKLINCTRNIILKLRAKSLNRFSKRLHLLWDGEERITGVQSVCKERFQRCWVLTFRKGRRVNVDKFLAKLFKCRKRFGSRALQIINDALEGAIASKIENICSSKSLRRKEISTGATHSRFSLILRCAEVGTDLSRIRSSEFFSSTSGFAVCFFNAIDCFLMFP